MNSLVKDEILTLDSREVAKMIGIRHADLIKKLEGDKTHIGVIPTLAKRQLSLR